MDIVVNYSYKGQVDQYVSTNRQSFGKAQKDLKVMSPNIHVINVNLQQKRQWFKD
jgi:hypothetical protein